MIDRFKVLAVVSARGGSMGVKNKNIRSLAGKPLIGYSLDLIEQSKYIDDYVISTDSDEIARTVIQSGFRIDFIRPVALADNNVSRLDVVRHAVTWYLDNRGPFDIVVDFGVATPLKNRFDLDSCIELLPDNKESNVITVTPAEKNPYFNMVEEREGIISVVKGLGSIASRQNAPSVYSMNDAFNVFWKKHLLARMNQINENTIMYIMPRERSIDIDEEIDFIIAEAIIALKNRSDSTLSE